jgi:hypothetical protein
MQAASQRIAAEGVACAQVHVELLPKLARKVEEGVLLTQASQMGSVGGRGLSGRELSGS